LLCPMLASLADAGWCWSVNLNCCLKCYEAVNFGARLAVACSRLPLEKNLWAAAWALTLMTLLENPLGV